MVHLIFIFEFCSCLNKRKKFNCFLASYAKLKIEGLRYFLPINLNTLSHFMALFIIEIQDRPFVRRIDNSLFIFPAVFTICFRIFFTLYNYLFFSLSFALFHELFFILSSTLSIRLWFVIFFILFFSLFFTNLFDFDFERCSIFFNNLK